MNKKIVIRYISESIEQIENLEQLHKDSISLCINSNQIEKFYKDNQDDCFFQYRTSNLPKSISVRKKSHYNVNNREIHLPCGVDIKILSSFWNKNYLSEEIYNIHKFSTKNFKENKKSFYRLFIGSEKSVRFDFYFKDLQSLDTEKAKYTWNGIKVKIFEKDYYLFLAAGYFMIDAIEKIAFDEFNEICRIILVCFGFITGYVSMEYGYFFEYSSSDFEKIENFCFDGTFMGSYDSVLKVVDTNHYQHMDEFVEENKKAIFKNQNQRIDEFVKKNKKPILSEIKKNLNGISQNTFSKLCENSYDDLKFFGMMCLLLQANQAPLVIKATSYSVILEMLADIIGESEDSLFYIKNKAKRKEFQENLTLHAKEFFESNIEEKFEKSPIEKRLNDINKPTNKDALVAPFKILDIKIDENDKEIIAKRNDFLHGRISNEEDFNKASQLLLYEVLKLNFLINALILKYVGHKGKIINLVKIFLANYEKTKNEKIYREI